MRFLQTIQLIFFLFLAALSACSQGTPPPGGETVIQVPPAPSKPKDPAPMPDVQPAGSEWKPDEVEVSCGAKYCPPQVGSLIFAEKISNESFVLHRCTAFLIESTVIMSNGHCDLFSAGYPGYFITQTIKGKKQIRRIQSLLQKVFTASTQGPEFTSGRPDMALFRLKEEIADIPPLRVAQGPTPDFRTLIIFGIVQNSSPVKQVIERIECQVRRHESKYPYGLNENPDMIRSFGCDPTRNTSGAPIFGEGSEEVQALQTGTIDPVRLAEEHRRTDRRELLIYEKQYGSISTNLSCLSFMNHQAQTTCTVVDDQTTEKRFLDYKNQAGLMSIKQPLLDLNTLYEWKVMPFQLEPSREMRFERIHFPRCRNEDEPSQVPFVIEQGRLAFNEWAEIEWQSSSRLEVSASVEAKQEPLLKMNISWPAKAAPYLQPEKDPRQKWGTTFAIEIPVCKR